MRTNLHFSPEECCHLDLHIIDYCQLHCKLLKQHQIMHSLSCTIHRENVHCLDHIIDLAIRTDSAFLNIGNYSPVIPCKLEPLRYNEWLCLKNKAKKVLAPHRIQVPAGCTETGCIGGILGLSVLPDGTYWDCSRNQNIIGSYPQKIVDVLDWNRIAAESCKNQFETCLRRIKK